MRMWVNEKHLPTYARTHSTTVATWRENQQLKIETMPVNLASPLLYGAPGGSNCCTSLCSTLRAPAAVQIVPDDLSNQGF